MHAKLIRPRYGLPVGTEGLWDRSAKKDDGYSYRFWHGKDHAPYEVVPGKDIRIDAPLHLYNNHDDIIAACYWADRLLNPDYTRVVYRNTGSGYFIRSVNNPGLSDYFERKGWVRVADSDDGIWNFLEEKSNRLLGGDPTILENQFIELEEQSWDEISDEDREVLDASMEYIHTQMNHQEQYHLCNKDDTQHILDMLHWSKIETYDNDVTNAIVIVGDGEYDEIWLTSGRYYELGATYFRVK